MKSDSTDRENQNYKRGRSLEADFKYKEAINKYLVASKEGSADAEYRLGLLYEKGLGVRLNMKSSIEWYELAAKKKHPLALYTLAIIYANGNYVKMNKRRAYKLFYLSKKYSKKDSFVHLNSTLNRSLIFKK